ncbi:MAG TPA: TlpA disulfide reductase family protein [Thermoanaerobaculaceae bacterium]|nr:TlpA disulfide reductase family protein [Thermoanaerobaculaceae bacterium]
MTRCGFAVAAAAALAVACGGGAKPPLARTESVTASGQTPDLRRWCDAYYTGAGAPALVLPQVKPARAGAAVPAVPADRWVWVNVWATWCGPCRREMPLLLDWQRQLRKDGEPVDTWFLSVDEREADLTHFLAENPGVAPGASLWLASPGGLDRWLAGFPGAPTGTIPLQIIAAPGGAVRCIRAGSLREGDYPIVKALLRP